MITTNTIARVQRSQKQSFFLPLTLKLFLSEFDFKLK